MFKVMSFIPHEKIANCGDVTEHNPEIILNNFTTRLGRRFGRFLGSMYPGRNLHIYFDFDFMNSCSPV